MNNTVSHIRIMVVCFGLILNLTVSAAAQPADNHRTVAGNLDSLSLHAKSALDSSLVEELELLAPRSCQRAHESFEEARRLMETGREPDLAGIKLRLSLDALEDARRTAATVRTVYSSILRERQSAREAGSDTLAFDAWRRAEDLMREDLRQFERDPSAVSAAGMEDIAGTYRAARREALRNQLLDDVRACLSEVEQRGGDRISPALLLRTHQAISRVEAKLAQENVDSARADAKEALEWAEHTRALVLYVEQAQKARQPWEAALLPYDDMLQDVAGHLGGRLDFSGGGAACGPQLNALVDARFDSLKQVIANQDTLRVTLEDSLSALQTLLSEAQTRIAKLERGEAIGDSTGASMSPEELTRRIARAQEAFKSEEAEVMQNPDDRVLIRLKGLQFASGATKLNKVHQRVLERAVIAINQFKGAALRVEGHTDNAGGTDINQLLSESRARNVSAFLAKKLRFADQQIESVGLGETQPIDSNESAEGRARNRRIDIILTLP